MEKMCPDLFSEDIPKGGFSKPNTKSSNFEWSLIGGSAVYFLMSPAICVVIVLNRKFCQSVKKIAYYKNYK